MRVASQPLLDTLAACAADAENVPAYAIIANLGLRVGLDDPWIRLLPVAAGVASIGLLTVWTRRHFDRVTALLVAVFCALSTFHIRYSQELRAYPYLLLVCTATLIVADRIRSRPDWRSTLALATTVALGCYTNLTYVLALVPVSGIVLMVPVSSRNGDRGTWKILFQHYSVGVLLGVLAFVPWIWLIWSTLTTRLARPRITEWTLEVIGQRWQGLTIARGHFDLLTWFGAVVAVFFVIGVVVAFRMRVGRSVLLPAVATLVAWETFLVAAKHWSVSRYDTALWPFLAVLVALGFRNILLLIRWKPLQWLMCVAVATLLLIHVDAYHRFGRPHWDVLAEAVTKLRRPGEAVMAADNVDRRCFTFYFDEPVVSINQKPDRLRRKLETTPSVLIFSRRPIPPSLLELADTHAELTNVIGTGQLYRLSRNSGVRSGEASDQGPVRPRSWPNPVDELVSERFDQPPNGCLGRWFGRIGKTPIETVSRIDFDSHDRVHMRSGWFEPTARDDGSSLAWVSGREASVDLRLAESAPGRIRIRMRTHPELAGRQWVRVVLNGLVLKEVQLRRGMQVIGFGVPPRVWVGERGVLTLQFSEVCCTEGNRRQRSAEIDWIEWTPRVTTDA